MAHCPTADQLEQALAGQLDARQFELIEAHVEGCLSCQRLLNELTCRADADPSNAEQSATAPSLTPVAELDPNFRQRLEQGPPPNQTTCDDAPNAAASRLQSPFVPPDVVGYEIIEKLGQGGMGVVYKAWHCQLKRVVALKMVLAGAHANADVLARFRTEVEAVARLQHPNVVQIYEVGDQDGVPYCALEYVEGVSLACKLDGTPLPPAEAAALVETLARAMHYAHGRGIIHCDLKPANVLLSVDSSPLSMAGTDGQGATDNGQRTAPKITDFGLAKFLAGGDEHTRTGTVLGTPSYMAPEQAQGNNRQVGPAADVYALGTILYETLTGRPPFRAATPLDTVLQVVKDEPVPPRQLQSQTPRDLETICLKCLRKEPAQRYGSAAALAEDLRRWQAGEAIAARPIGRGERAVKWLRRHPALTAALVLAVFATAAAGVFAFQKYQAEQEHLAERRRLEEQVRAEKRENAMDKAVAAAMGGDKVAADNAIAEADTLGASTGQVQLLRGLVAYCNGDAAEAIRHLQAARELMGDSAAVCALLVLAFGSESDFIGFAREMDQLEQLPVRTAEDHLFKAWAIGATLDPIRGLALLDEPTPWRSTGIGRLIRAALSQAKANLSGNLQDAETAAKDAQTACDLLQGNAYALANRAFASLLLAYIHRRAGRDADSQREIGRAWEDVQALEAFPTCTFGWFARYVYLCRKGDPAAALMLCRVAVEQGQRNFLMTYLVGECQQGNQRVVRRELERAKPLDEKWGLALLNAWVLLESPEGVATVRRFYAEITAKPKSFGTALWPIPIALLLGDPDLAKVTAIEVCGKYARTPWRGGWYSDIAKFCAGDLTVQQFEKIANDSLLNQCEGHFFIGMKLLAQGDRRSAAEHFRKSVDTPCEAAEDYVFSSAFLDRLEKDPNWPPWIPNKEDNRRR